MAAWLAVLKTRNGLQQLLLAGAGNTRDAQNLAAAGGKAHVAETGDPIFILHGQVLNLDALRYLLRFRTINVQLYGPSHHHVGESLGIRFTGLHISDVLAFSQYRHPVGHVHDLVQLVGDNDQSLTVCFHVPHDRKQLIGFLRGQDSGGFVQNQDIRAPIKDFHDFHRLFLRHGHVVDLLIGVNVEAVSVGDLFDL
ncbi:hypothetical protein SDC9_115913 [bioreactor metagenome]|uniref:Uncharacterized protein n=1 Tax=bioreactor metagenome TaxID=1076179 RepID=A0A645BUA7_9ZZZZ